jgi:hypothetical protein
VKLKTILLSIFFFFIGITPTFFTENYEPWNLRHYILISQSGHINLAFFGNLIERINQLKSGLLGELDIEVHPVLHYLMYVNLFLVGSSFFFLLLSKKAKNFFLILMFTILLMLLTIVPAQAHPNNLYSIYPIVAVGVGIFLNFLYKKSIVIFIIIFEIVLFFNFLVVGYAINPSKRWDALKPLEPKYENSWAFSPINPTSRVCRELEEIVIPRINYSYTPLTKEIPCTLYISFPS